MHHLVALVATALLFMAPAPATAAEPSVCATCVDGPEMFQHVKLSEGAPVVEAISFSCNIGPLLKTFGKADWLVNVCSDGSLMFQPAPKNGASHPFTYHYGEMETPSPYIEERFRDKRARAAYLEVKALTPEQFDALVRQIRASVKD
jgi:hypothetical protein